MNGIFVLAQNEVAKNLAFLPKVLTSNFAKIAKLQIKDGEQNSAVLKKYIKDFNELSAKNDFVVVIGADFIDKIGFNAKIANVLNLPIISVCDSENSAKTVGEILKENKIIIVKAATCKTNLITFPNSIK